MANFTTTEISRTTIQADRNDHKYGTTPVWQTTVVYRIDWHAGYYAGKSYRRVEAYESTTEHGTGQMLHSHQEPWTN